MNKISMISRPNPLEMAYAVAVLVLFGFLLTACGTVPAKKQSLINKKVSADTRRSKVSPTTTQTEQKQPGNPSTPSIASQESVPVPTSQFLPPLPENAPIPDTPDTNEEDLDEEIETTYDVPIILNKSVEGYIEYFQTVVMKDRFALWLSRSQRYLPMMRDIFKQRDLPEDLVFVALIESGFNPYAYSRAKATGPWQFMKGTAKKYGLKIDNWVDERRDPIKSTWAAASYLKDLYRLFGSWPLALASYNAGEGRVQRALIKAKGEDFWDLNNSRYLRQETRGYVPKFMAATIIAKNPERYGFSLEYAEPLKYEEATVEGSVDMHVIAESAGIGFEDLKALNPELKREITPPTSPEYIIRLPEGTKETFLKQYVELSHDKKFRGMPYRVKRGETLSTIAQKFDVSTPVLQAINHLEDNAILHEGDNIYLPASSVPAITPKKKRTTSRVSTASRENSRRPEPLPPNGRKIFYEVQIGDTLWEIAKNFNIPVDQLRRWNGLGRRSIIRPGDKLVLTIPL
jgi:membrane-bound lytic murein transglycosylase D